LRQEEGIETTAPPFAGNKNDGKENRYESYERVESERIVDESTQ
jgi:hypothetical protein